MDKCKAERIEEGKRDSVCTVCGRLFLCPLDRDPAWLGSMYDCLIQDGVWSKTHGRKHVKQRLKPKKKRTQTAECVYLGGPTEDEVILHESSRCVKRIHTLFECEKHGLTLPSVRRESAEGHQCCHECPDFATERVGEINFPSPPSVLPVRCHRTLEITRPMVTDRYGGAASLENSCMGASVFLVLSGPSLNKLELSLLNRRGIVTFGVNNAACVVRTDFWTSGDTPSKFHEAIWRDPGICKFVGHPKFNQRIAGRRGGEIVELNDRVFQMPNVFGIERNYVFEPSTYLHENSVNFGQGDAGVEANGRPKVINTMFQAVRLCYYLGFRTVYLLGCDFSMSEEYRYAFDEHRSRGAVRSNNSAYEKMNAMWAELVPYFDEAKFKVYNCTRRSGLRAFEHVQFEDAIRRATAAIPDHTDTRGWYAKDDRKTEGERDGDREKRRGRKRRRHGPAADKSVTAVHG